MILSRSHKFIFIKTRRTAGTSIEVFLSRLAGDDAIVTDVLPPVPGHVPRNRDGYVNHMRASQVRNLIGEREWKSYFTFCFERNPWDKTLSWYEWWYRRRTEPGAELPFGEWVERSPLPSDFRKYTFDDRTVGIDFIGRYETIHDDLRGVLKHLGLAVTVDLTREKDSSQAHSPKPVWDTRSIEAVARAFSREIDIFGYQPPYS